MAALPPFPTFDIEGRKFTRLLLGHNPFLGGSYMSEARSRFYRETFCDPAAIERIIRKSIELGVRGMVTSLSKDFTPRFRESAYTPVKKVVDTDARNFDEMKENVLRASEAAIKKKERVLAKLRGRK